MPEWYHSKKCTATQEEIDSRMTSWRQAIKDLEQAIADNDMKQAHQRITKLAKFQKVQASVKSLVLDSG
jgi:hypothetical protein